MSEVVLIFAIVSLIALIIFLGFLLYGVYAVPSGFTPIEHEPADISVVTAVRNDKRINRLNEVIKQIRDIQNFEWVVVDDGSEIPICPSETNIFIRIHYRRAGRRKKQALKSGIRVSKGKVLAFIDADCIPTKNWLHIITSPIALGKADLVYGHSIMEGKTFGSKVAIFDHWINSMLTFGLAGYNLHYNATGRSMAIKREVFFRTGEFSSHEEIPSGDDDLLLNEALKKGYVPMAILNKQSIVKTDAPKRIWDLIRQRTRHVQTSFRYPFKLQLILSLFWLFYFTNLISIIVLLPFNWAFVIGLLTLRWFTIGICMLLSSNRLTYKPNLHLPATDFVLFFVYIMIALNQLQRTSAHE